MATTTITANTDDGHISGDDASYANARATATGTDDTSTTFIVGQHDSPSFQVWRGFVRFDTSPLSGATVTAATLKVWKEGHIADQDYAMWVYRYGWASSLSANKEANYDGAYGSGVFEGELWENGSYPSDGAYVSLAVSPAGVNTSGYTGYALVSSNDQSNIEARGEEYATFSSANHGTSGQRPVLEITYTPAAGGVPNSLMLMGIGG